MHQWQKYPCLNKDGVKRNENVLDVSGQGQLVAWLCGVLLLRAGGRGSGQEDGTGGGHVLRGRLTPLWHHLALT